MQRVRVSRRSLRPFRRIIGRELYQEIEERGGSLDGLKVVHVSATPQGGGVAEILQSFVPLVRDVRIDAEWYVMDPDEAFFRVSKRLHNLLQGAPGELSAEEQRVYLEHNQRTYEQMRELRPDVWVIHDPQPAAVGSYLNQRAPRVWRSHIDTSHPNPSAAAFLAPFVQVYEALVYSHESYRFPGVAAARAHIIEPAIDPLTRKNRRLLPRRARQVLARLGIDPKRPLVAQVARLDPWKDPMGVIDAYRLARGQTPGLQLALLGVMAATDDPEAAEVYRAVRAHARDDPDIHIYIDPEVVGQEEVAAVQTAADVLLQKSIREGFGLSATEAMWKGKPVIVGDVGGLSVQVVDGQTGYRVQDTEECAERLVALLRDPAAARRIGRAGRERVRERYLVPRLLRDELRLYRSALDTAAPGQAGQPTTTVAVRGGLLDHEASF